MGTVECSRDKMHGPGAYVPHSVPGDISWYVRRVLDLDQQCSMHTARSVYTVKISMLFWFSNVEQC
jgi:hypothetical protein